MKILRIPNKKVEEWLWQLMSLYVRLRDKKCVLCGSVLDLQAGHIYSRRYKSIKFDEMNVFCQCGKCNENHNNPNLKYKFYDWFINQFGEQSFVNLGRRKDHVKELTYSGKLRLIELYKTRLSTSLNIDLIDDTPMFLSAVRKEYNAYRN